MGGKRIVDKKRWELKTKGGEGRGIGFMKSYRKKTVPSSEGKKTWSRKETTGTVRVPS